MVQMSINSLTAVCEVLLVRRWYTFRVIIRFILDVPAYKRLPACRGNLVDRKMLLKHSSPIAMLVTLQPLS